MFQNISNIYQYIKNTKWNEQDLPLRIVQFVLVKYDGQVPKKIIKVCALTAEENKKTLQ